MVKPPRPTDEAISGAVQHFIDEYEFEPSDPPSRKSLETFAADSGFPYNRVRYAFRELMPKGFDMTPYLDATPAAAIGQPWKAGDTLDPPKPAEEPAVTRSPWQQAAEFAKTEFECPTHEWIMGFPTGEWLEAAAKKTGLRSGLLHTAFVNEKKSRK
jgi:hypothetical protein